MRRYALYRVPILVLVVSTSGKYPSTFTDTHVLYWSTFFWRYFQCIFLMGFSLLPVRVDSDATAARQGGCEDVWVSGVGLRAAAGRTAAAGGHGGEETLNSQLEESPCICIIKDRISCTILSQLLFPFVICWCKHRTKDGVTKYKCLSLVTQRDEL